jgi:hypothetical protein
MTTAQVQVGWRFVSEGLPAHGEFFSTLPSGIGEGDSRYEPVFLLEEDAANEAPLGRYVPPEQWDEWEQVGWQKVDTGELIRLGDALAAEDPNLRPVHRRV